MSGSYKSIQIVIDEKGKVHIKTSGFVGEACIREAEALIARLQQAGLDVETENVKLTEEAHKIEQKGHIRAKGQ